MPKKRYTFTNKDKNGQVANVGYLDMETNSNNKDKCKLYFYGDITSEQWLSDYYAEDKCPQDIADFLNALDGYEEIEIHFNSGGGDVFAGIAIYNQLMRYQGHKVGYVDGMAASIASVIMFSCDELIFLTGAQAMIHDPACAVYGNETKLLDIVERLRLAKGSIVDAYMRHTKEGVSREEIEDMMTKETWFNAEKMKQYFDVEIEDSAAVAACSSSYFDKYVSMPEHKPECLQNKQPEEEKIAAEKAAILEDLYLYG